jgi:hypothetical protein
MKTARPTTAAAAIIKRVLKPAVIEAQRRQERLNGS